MTDPFHPPEADATDPLCPWRYPDHLRWYVDVDGTGAQYEQFRRALEMKIRQNRLDKKGLLVVVTGETGCGKTSLLHRCADLVDELTNRGDPDYVRSDLVLDMSGYLYSRDSRDVEIRMPEACAELVHLLGRQGSLPIDPTWRGGAVPPDFRAVYRSIAGLAERMRLTPIVLLPGVSDNTKELDQYLYLAQNCARIVFFAESSDAAITEWAQKWKETTAEVIGLTVNSVQQGDTWAVIVARLGGNAGDVFDEQDVRVVEQYLSSVPVGSIRWVTRRLQSAWAAWSELPSPRKMTARDILDAGVPYLTFGDNSYAVGGDNGE